MPGLMSPILIGKEVINVSKVKKMGRAELERQHAMYRELANKLSDHNFYLGVKAETTDAQIMADVRFCCREIDKWIEKVDRRWLVNLLEGIREANMKGA
jgi:hypothetical protein